MNEQMYGVVLWTDKRVNSAVIWCEDHGNLAFYQAAETSMHDDFVLDAGDLIQFDLREEPECRHARNLRRVDEGFAPGLANQLLNAGEASSQRADAKVIQFPGR